MFLFILCPHTGNVAIILDEEVSGHTGNPLSPMIEIQGSGFRTVVHVVKVHRFLRQLPFPDILCIHDKNIAQLAVGHRSHRHQHPRHRHSRVGHPADFQTRCIPDRRNTQPARIAVHQIPQVFCRCVIQAVQFYPAGQLFLHILQGMFNALVDSIVSVVLERETLADGQIRLQIALVGFHIVLVQTRTVPVQIAHPQRCVRKLAVIHPVAQPFQILIVHPADQLGGSPVVLRYTLSLDQNVRTLVHRLIDTVERTDRKVLVRFRIIPARQTASPVVIQVAQRIRRKRILGCLQDHLQRFPGIVPVARIGRIAAVAAVCPDPQCVQAALFDQLFRIPAETLQVFFTETVRPVLIKDIRNEMILLAIGGSRG